MFSRPLRFFVCHAGAAEHLAAFINKTPDLPRYEIYASQAATEKFEEKGVRVMVPLPLGSSEEDTYLDMLVKSCAEEKLVITDVGHSFTVKVQKALREKAPHVLRFAYYDNPESYVPGGYSQTAAEVIQASQTVLFANANLAERPIFQAPGEEIDFGIRQKIGIGYYPIDQAQKIAERRVQEQGVLRAELRLALFQQHRLAEEGQKILLYLGGNNTEYFSKAFPAFLSLLEESMREVNLAHLVILFQQHPGAKANNTDGALLKGWIDNHALSPNAPKILLSDLPPIDAQTIADGVLYYQTSIAPQLVLADIPTIQIGHETYEDLLVRNNLVPSVTAPRELIAAVTDLSARTLDVSQKVRLRAELGMRRDWLANLQNIVKKAIPPSPLPRRREVFLLDGSSLPYYLLLACIVGVIGWLLRKENP